MRSNRETTSQTTCDDERCSAYAITAFFQPTTSGAQAAKHRRDVATDGWIDHEGRDYCPEHNPVGAPSTEEATR